MLCVINKIYDTNAGLSNRRTNTVLPAVILEVLVVHHEPAFMRLFDVLLFLLVIHGPGVAWAGEVPFSFENAELNTVIEKASELTGLAFLYNSKQVKEKISLHLPQEVSPEETLELLRSALSLHSYTLLRRENTVWIVPAAQAGHLEVVPLDYAEAGELAYTLSQLAPEGVRIVPYYPTNSLILYGDPKAVRALIQVIKGQK
jgi:type II secretory pathway component GspD/PulD (secretin)